MTGESYQLEDDRFRDTMVITADDRQITGLLSRRMNLYGLITGQTSTIEIHDILGEPAGTFPLNQEAARLYGLPEGRLLTYHYPDTRLQFFADNNNTLTAIWLDQNKVE